MIRLTICFCLPLLFAACAPPLTAPHGGSWDDFYRAKHELVVTYQGKEVAGCQPLGPVSGFSYRDLLEAKEDAEEQAVILGGDHLHYQNLRSEWLPYLLVYEKERFYADGTAYRCVER